MICPCDMNAWHFSNDTFWFLFCFGFQSLRPCFCGFLVFAFRFLFLFHNHTHHSERTWCQFDSRLSFFIFQMELPLHYLGMVYIKLQYVKLTSCFIHSVTLRTSEKKTENQVVQSIAVSLVRLHYSVLCISWFSGHISVCLRILLITLMNEFITNKKMYLWSIPSNTNVFLDSKLLFSACKHWCFLFVLVFCIHSKTEFHL